MQYQKFKQIYKLLKQTNSNTFETVQQILILRNKSKIKTSQMRKYSDTFILQRAEYYWNKNKQQIKNKNKESSETNMPNTSS